MDVNLLLLLFFVFFLDTFSLEVLKIHKGHLKKCLYLVPLRFYKATWPTAAYQFCNAISGVGLNVYL